MKIKSLTKSISIIFMFSALLFGCCTIEDTPKSEEKNKTTTYKVVFDANGGNGSMPAQIFTAGTSQKLNTNTFKRTGYTFAGWNTEPDGTGFVYISGNSYSLTANITLYAQWEKEDGLKIRIVFDVNGTNETVPATIEAAAGENITLPVLENDNFLCWNTRPDGTGTNYSGTATFNESVILYAQWKIVKVVITFDTNGISEITPTAIKTSSGESVNLPTLTNDKFSHWNTKPDGTGISYSGIAVFSEDVTLYAILLPENAYKVVYMLDGGINNPANPYYLTDGETVVLSAPTKDKHTFAGWYTDEACTENQVTQITQNPESNIVLYAKWIANKTTITITQNEPEVNLQQKQNGSIVTFTADDGYNKYIWSVDGVKQSETSSTFTIDTSGMMIGKIHKVAVIVLLDGEYYSTSADLEIKGGD